MAEIAIGIDLGTSNSCVAARRGDTTEVLPNAYGERTTASVVFFQESGSISVGNAARANIIHDPSRTIASAKRLIGRYFRSEEVSKARAICSYNIAESESHGVLIEVGDEKFTLPEISAMVLREMKTIAETGLMRSEWSVARTGVETFTKIVTIFTPIAGRSCGARPTPPSGMTPNPAPIGLCIRTATPTTSAAARGSVAATTGAR